MVFSIAVVQRVRTNAQSEGDHEDLKKGIMYNINTKQGKACKEQGQKGAMNGTGQRSPDTQSIPIDFYFHKGQQM